jgi:hypothetical protein
VTSTTKTVDAETVAREVRALADEFAQHRLERQRRRELDRADFDRLQAAGFRLRAAVSGGIQSIRRARSPRCCGLWPTATLRSRW